MLKSKHLEEIIDRIIDLKSFENGADMRKKLEALKKETDRNRIRSGLNELKIMKMDIKEELEEIRPELMSLKKKERMARFKIEEIKELKMELKELESELKPKIKFTSRYLKN